MSKQDDQRPIKILKEAGAILRVNALRGDGLEDFESLYLQRLADQLFSVAEGDIAKAMYLTAQQ